MKPSHPLACIAATGLLTLASAHAATLSVTSGPTFSPTITNTLSQQTINGNLIKISGNASFMQTSTPVNEITMTLQGTFSALQGDSFTLDYELTSQLNSLVSMTYALQVDVSANTPIGLVNLGTVVNDTGTLDPGFNSESGLKSAEVLAAAFTFGSPATGTFTARFVLNTSTLANGDSFTLTIPNNSIDLILAPVPEPSSLALSGLGAIGLVFGTRRRTT